MISSKIEDLCDEREHIAVDLLTRMADRILRDSGETFCLNEAHVVEGVESHDDSDNCLYYAMIGEITDRLLEWREIEKEMAKDH